ncbi:unnamed protein product [Prunus armeniaca]|uniref:Uncharacterized protein n=1 Tax=Prunus armeniaca TaxID=36596 RepID=A0A6J5THG5_PRUAR|nr:unnamed protein product [Prunus armeniaca]CAB4294002.1 unnamed protein product [Prunus armeniaca]
MERSFIGSSISLCCSRELHELLDSGSCTIFGASHVTGFSIDVFKAALEVLPYATFEFIPFSKSDGRQAPMLALKMIWSIEYIFG